MTLTSKREIELLTILNEHDVDFACLTECEMKPAATTTFSIPGYQTYPEKTSREGKVRTMILAKVGLDVNILDEHMGQDKPIVWVSFEELTIASVYREFSCGTDGAKNSTKWRVEQLDELMENIMDVVETANTSVLLGDFNLDAAKVGQGPEYYMHKELAAWDETMDQLQLYRYETKNTFHQNRVQVGDEVVMGRVSTLDHVYINQDASHRGKVKEDSATDHFPVLLTLERPGQANKEKKFITRRDYKNLKDEDLCKSLLATHDWNVHVEVDVDNPNDLHEYILKGLNKGLDMSGPFKEMEVKAGKPLHLRNDTKLLMKMRDFAKKRHRKSFPALRNAVTISKFRDQMEENLRILKERGPDAAWDIKNRITGKEKAPLPMLAESNEA